MSRKNIAVFFVLFLFAEASSAIARQRLSVGGLEDARLVVAAAQTTMPRRHALFTEDMEVIRNSCQTAYTEQTHKKLAAANPSWVKTVQTWFQPKDAKIMVLNNRQLVAYLRKTTRDPLLIGRLLELKRLADGALPSQEYIKSNLSSVSYLVLSQPDRLRANFLLVYDELVWRINSKDYLGCTQLINHLLSEDGGIL